MYSKKELVSIIIPVFNVEDYLPDCLSSIINQTYKNIEIICINDGSTDSSLKILENYSKKDARIKIINQKNSGVCAARNNGLERASGDYIVFCDSDDKLAKNLIEKITDEFDKKNCDIVCYGHSVFVDEKCVYENNRELEQIINYNREKDIINFQVYIWNKAYRKEFLDKNHLRFKLGLKCAEDLVFTLSALFCGAKYSYISESLYYYRANREGNTTWKNINGVENDLLSLRTLVNSDLYKKQSLKTKILTVNHFIGGSINYYRKFQEDICVNKLINDIRCMLNFVEHNFSKMDCLKMPNYLKLCKIIWKYDNRKIFEKFNIITTNEYKKYVFFGKQITVKRHL